MFTQELRLTRSRGGRTAYKGAAPLAALLVSALIPLMAAAPAHADGEQTWQYWNYGGTDNVNYNTIFGTGTYTAANIKKTIWQDAGSSALGALDDQITGGMTGGNNYDWAVGLWDYDSTNVYSPATLNIPSGVTVAGEFDGNGWGYAAGIESFLNWGNSGTPALVVNNSGTVSGAVYWNDGVAAGLDSNVNYGDSDITNNPYSNFTATANWYTTAVHNRTNFGNISVYQYGSLNATSSGGTQGAYANQGWAVGLDLQIGSTGNINVNNTGVTNGTVKAGGGEACGAYLWANGGGNGAGNLTLDNTGTFSANGSATVKGVYCGGNGTAVSVTNSGTISATSQTNTGWALETELDGSGTETINNSGTLTTNATSGLFIVSTTGSSPSSGGTGPVIVRNTGTIKGGTGINSAYYNGPITIYDHGTVTGTGGSAISLSNSKANTVYVYGTPSVGGTMYSGPGGTLTLHITAPITSSTGGNGVNDANLANDGFGTSGSITAGGNTYSWNNMTVTGAAAKNYIANGTYYIVNRYSGLVLDEPGGQNSNGTPLDQWSKNNGSNQQWTLTGLGNGKFELVNGASGLALDDYNAGTGDGNEIDVWSYGNNQSNQQWLFTPTASGSSYYTISPACAPGSCIDVPDASQSQGVSMQLYTLADADAWPSGGEGQQWALVKA